MAQFSTTDKRLYIVNTDAPQQRVDIQFFPTELAFSRQINGGKVDVVGRNNPIDHYTSGAKTFKLTLDFYGEDDDLKDVMRRISLIESWTMNDGAAKRKPLIKVIFGDLFKAEVWVIDKCDWRLTQFDKLNGVLPRQAYMDLGLSLHTKGNLKASDVRGVW